MARKFLLVAAGILLLALSYHLSAGRAGAQSAGFASPTEVAVRQGVLTSGETIPLPTYADGTTAVESECHWTVSLPYFGSGNNWCYTADASYGAPPDGPPSAPFHNPGYYAVHPGRVVNAGSAGSGNPSDANYIIIAVRGASQPTPALHESWGQVKSRYRTAPPATPGMTVTPGAENR